MKFSEFKNWDREQVVQAFESELIGLRELCLYDFYHRHCYWPDFTGKDVKRLRDNQNLSQAELALILGLDKSTIVRWEKMDDNLPSLVKVLLAIMTQNGAIHLAKWASKTKEAEKQHTGSNMYYFQQPSSEAFEFDKDVPECIPEVEADIESYINNRLLSTDDVTPLEIVKLRLKLKMSRHEFAKFMNVSISTVDKWETNKAKISGTAKVIFRLLERNDNVSSWIRYGLMHDYYLKQIWEKQSLENKLFF